MKKILFIITLVMACIFLVGAVTYLDNDGLGVRVFPQVVLGVPVAPFVCTVDHIGKQTYVDDTNDTNEAYLCFCGDSNDAGAYKWMKTESPAVDCF